MEFRPWRLRNTLVCASTCRRAMYSSTRTRGSDCAAEVPVAEDMGFGAGFSETCNHWQQTLQVAEPGHAEQRNSCSGHRYWGLDLCGLRWCQSLAGTVRNQPAQ